MSRTTSRRPRPSRPSSPVPRSRTARAAWPRPTWSGARSSGSASSASCARTSATSSATTRRTSRPSPARASSCGSPSSKCTRWTPTTGSSWPGPRPESAFAISRSAAPRSARSTSISPTMPSSRSRSGWCPRPTIPWSGSCASSRAGNSARPPMKIHEYQAKAILREFGVPVPNGEVADTPAQAKAIASKLGGKVVVKAQVHAGGRGKAGGVKLADDPAGAEAAAKQILGMMLKTPQTPPEGIRVLKVLVEEASPIATELYLSITLDRAKATHVVMASQAGGMEIEEVAATHPEKILREWTDPALGLQPFQARNLAFGLGLSGDQFKAGIGLVLNLFRAYLDRDCSLAEINPLVLTRDGRVLALDAKLNFDDNALYRRKDIVALRDINEETPLDVEASKYGLNYIKLDGNVGCMVNGAGLAMATMDIIKLAGGEPANFLDVGGGASPEQIENAFRILSSDPSVKAVFINVFGGILRVDRLAEGIITAVKKLGLTLPVVLRAEGTNVEIGKKMLADSGLALVMADDMGEGAHKAVELARAVRG